MGIISGIKKGYKKAKKGVKKVGKVIDKGVDKLEDLGDKAKEAGEYINDNKYLSYLSDKAGSALGVDNLSDKIEQAGNDFEDQTDVLKTAKTKIKSAAKKARNAYDKAVGTFNNAVEELKNLEW